MAGFPRFLLALVSLAGLANGIFPGIFPPGKAGKPFGGPAGPGGNPLAGLFGGRRSGLGLGGASAGGGLGPALSALGAHLPSGKIEAGPGGFDATGIIPGLLQLSTSLKPHRGAQGPAASPFLVSPAGGGLPGVGLGGGGPAVGLPPAIGTPGAGDPAANIESGSARRDGSVAPTSATTTTGAGAAGSGGSADSSEETGTKKKSEGNGGGSSGGSTDREKPPERVVAGGSGGSGSNAPDSAETETKKKDHSRENDRDPRERKPRKKKSKKNKRRRRLQQRDDEDSRRKKRSLMDEFSLMGTKGAHHAFDNVPDHVKVVYCGRHEVPNPGGIEDHFCHPDATWDTLLRMRPDCICQQGFLRNSWGECISPAECDHCSDKHHLNMDYHLCESPCPIVCNQPIDEDCPNTCFKECACRPGYIRAYPNGPCVSIKQCLPGCRGRNQIFSLCSSLCPPTCRKPVPKRCPNICAGEGCVCKPGYVVKKWEPLVCVRPENCPGRRKKCPGPNQRYSRCIRRCAPSCFRRRHRYCGHDCLGRGCVCKRGYVVLQRRPLVCVRRDECPARRKKCPARNQVYMYCKSKCPRTCEEPKPRKCGSACGGEGCACKPGYVMKQEDPLLCVRQYQCDLEDMGLKGAKGSMGAVGAIGAKGAMGAKGSMGATGAIEATGAKGAMGATAAMESMGAKGAMGATGAMEAKGVKGAKSSSPYPPLPSWPSPPNYF